MYPESEAQGCSKMFVGYAVVAIQDPSAPLVFAETLGAANAKFEARRRKRIPTATTNVLLFILLQPTD